MATAERQLDKLICFITYITLGHKLQIADISLEASYAKMEGPMLT